MRRMLAALALVAAAAALAGCAGLGNREDVSLVPEEDRSPAPAFRVPALDGSGEVSLADHAGRPVVLNFWASWCGPCQNEMPALVEFSAATPGVDVVGLAVTDVPAESRAFARDVGVDFELGIDRRGDTIARFGGSGLPITVFVDEEGRVAGAEYGEVTRRQLDEYADLLGA